MKPKRKKGRDNSMALSLIEFPRKRPLNGFGLRLDEDGRYAIDVVCDAFIYPEECRKLAAWLLKAADWLEGK